MATCNFARASGLGAIERCGADTLPGDPFCHQHRDLVDGDPGELAKQAQFQPVTLDADEKRMLALLCREKNVSMAQAGQLAASMRTPVADVLRSLSRKGLVAPKGRDRFFITQAGLDRCPPN